MRRTLSAIAFFAISLSLGASPIGALGSESLALAFAIRHQSPDVRFQIETEGGRTRFHIGEIIPLKLSFTSATANKYQITMATYDRSGRMQYERFQIEPEVEHALAERFAAEPLPQRAENIASLLHRYATDSILPQVLAVADKILGKCACDIQTPLLAYLLRVNAAVARSRIEAAMLARGSGYSACNHSLLAELGALQPDPMQMKASCKS